MIIFSKFLIFVWINYCILIFNNNLNPIAIMLVKLVILILARIEQKVKIKLEQKILKKVIV